ncbi:MAG: GGDEF domain-containing protein [Burkholderiales bacterium]|jgi:diguanylate cyclase (GGDEF)-like protein|nr:MAG: GGDEF domain-containing protein [Burkholderiales bacterium]
MLNGLKHLTVGLIEVPSIPNPLQDLRRPGFDLTGPRELDQTPVQAEESRQIDRLLEQGFPWLRFPAELEARFFADHAAQRRKLLLVSGALTTVLFNWLLLSDWLMVPDMVEQALKLRLFVFTPCTLIGLYLIARWPPPIAREWLATGLGLTAALFNIYVCTTSKDPLAGPYLVSLVPIVMFSNSVAQMRFFPALVMDLFILLMYGYGVHVLADQSPMAVMIPAGLTLTSAIVFTLYGCYVLERDERQNWLLRLREQMLLRELEQANRHLDEASRCDILTQVSNRRHFDEFLQQVWERARRDGSEISLMMIDVDHFKAYNDRYGHPEGDTCLKDVAAMLKRRLRRPGDLIARFGGEEFIAILSGAPLTTAASAAERVRKGVEELNRPHASSPTQPMVTVSIGVACLRPNSPYANPAQLIAAADEALYQAKSRGRNRVFAFGTQD